MNLWLLLVDTESGDHYQYIFDYPITKEEAHAFFFDQSPDEYSVEFGSTAYVKIKPLEVRSRVPDELIEAYHKHIGSRK